MMSRLDLFSAYLLRLCKITQIRMGISYQRNIVGNQEPPQINLNLQVGFMVHQDILV
jgi:hypothetical protein